MILYYIVQRFDISPFFRCTGLFCRMTNEKRLSVSMRSKVNRWRTFEDRQAIDARLICTSDWTPDVSNTILKFSFSEDISFLPLWGDVAPCWPPM